MKAIKTFRDLLAFLTVIPLGNVVGFGNVRKRRVAAALVFVAGVLLL